MDVFLFEADPKTWPGDGLLPNAMDQQSRGDRYWSKRNAAASLMIVSRIQVLVHQTQQLGDVPPPLPETPEDDGQDLEEAIASAERDASKLMKKLTGSNGKT